MKKSNCLTILILWLALAMQGVVFAEDNPIQVTIIQAADGVEIMGQLEYGGLPATAPLIALFHQAGSNGRGEYGPLIPWLNENGFSAIAWDLRKGGDLFGSMNVTAKGREEIDESFCDAYQDVEAALKKTFAVAEGAPVIIWGSSYSGALVFQAAAKNPELIDGVIAFSPASGGPLAACRARDFLGDVTAPAFVLRPASEMERESSREQRDLFVGAGVEFAVVNDGVHGSSMLVDERTKHDMSSARALVMDWLKATSNKNEN